MHSLLTKREKEIFTLLTFNKTTKQIAEEINKKGFNIDKKMIKPLVPVDTLGVHNVDIELHKKVIAVAKIEVKEV